MYILFLGPFFNRLLIPILYIGYLVDVNMVDYLTEQKDTVRLLLKILKWNLSEFRHKICTKNISQANNL